MVSPLTIDGEENALLATIDDALSRKQLKNATAEYNAAKQKAESDIDIRVAKAAADTAWFEFDHIRGECQVTLADLQMQWRARSS